MQNNLPNNFGTLVTEIREYFRVRLKLLKLTAIEQAAKLVADLVTNTLVVVCMLMAFIIFTLTLAFYLSEELDSYGQGFGCTTLFLALLMTLFLWKKTVFESFVGGIIIRRYFAKHHEAQEEKVAQAGADYHPENTINASSQESKIKSENSPRKKVTLKGLWDVLKNTFTGFGDHKVTKLSGSLAYYTVFSMAPLLVVIISLCGIFLGQEAAQGQIYSQLAGFIGKETALQLQEIVQKAAIGNKDTIAFIIGVVTLLIGATSVFADIQDSINGIWGLKPKPKRGWLKMLQNRFLSFSVIISLGFLLLVSLGVTSVLDGISERLQARFSDVSVVVFYILNQVLTLAVVSLIFGVIFKVLPDAKIKWHDVIYGAIVTALLFMLGKLGISIYIGQSEIGSTYGGAGSLVVILLWTYYSSIILYLGAEFTKAYAVASGSEIKPSHYAVSTKEVEIETSNTSIQENESKQK